jgi:hypothetical protein
MIFWGANADEGPAALPGDYTVRITANGVTKTQPLKIEKDPRLPQVTQEDLKKQFDLAMKIRDEVTEANDMVTHIRELRTTLADDEKKATSPALKTASDDFLKKLTAIEEDLYQVRNRSGQDPLNFPIKLNNLIGALGSSVMLGDGAPTAQAYVVYNELTARLQQQKTLFDQTMSTGLTQINPILEQNKLPAIK